MNLTNKANLPEPLVNAIAHNSRDREGCTFTITELIRPARQAVLENQHADEVTEDASDRLWALMGSAGHEVLRRSSESGIVEERAVVDLIVNGVKVKVGGQIDYAKGSDTLWDYKFTSVYAVKEGAKPEWIQQLNCYRWLAKQYGVEFTRLAIVVIFRDWSVREARRDPSYPQSQAQVFELPLWELIEVERWIRERIEAHTAALATLPECTSEEVWERPTTWAVKKPKNVRATKVFFTPSEAESFAKTGDFVVEVRPGERPRCESYCRVSKWCQQYQSWQKGGVL